MALFLYLLEQPNAKGYIWKQYIETIIKYNAEQIYRQATIDLQQQKKLDITNDIYQNIIKRQGNSRLNINGDKISGDLTLIGINNKAKLEGIYSFDDKAKVKFCSIKDKEQTEMCKSLDKQEFYVHDWNKFERYSKSNDYVKKYRCYGLIPGLNLPPIDDGFHWCRSYIIYLPSVEKEDKREYNLDIPKINEEVRKILENTKLNSRARKLFNRYLTRENTEINNNLDVAMRYSINKNKILINPMHRDFKYYDLQKSLTHEIAHMIDIRNNINIKNITGDIRRSRIDILANEEEYKNIFNIEKFANNMELSDVFSAITKNQIAGNYIHDNKYWADSLNVEREIKANIVTAYITKNKEFMNIIRNIKSLNNLKDEVIKEYAKRIS